MGRGNVNNCLPSCNMAKFSRKTFSFGQMNYLTLFLPGKISLHRKKLTKKTKKKYFKYS